jgi:four helix bundle protein
LVKSISGDSFGYIINLIMRKNDLEERLINFSVAVLGVSGKMKKTTAGIHLSGQLVRSSTSAALNYGECQSAESRKDFVHKMKVVLKELRETFVNMKIVYRSGLYDDQNELKLLLVENNELISIFVVSVKTASDNLAIKEGKPVNKKV